MKNWIPNKDVRLVMLIHLLVLVVTLSIALYLDERQLGLKLVGLNGLSFWAWIVLNTMKDSMGL